MFPAAMAMGNIQSGIIAGKLNGQMPATTPTGTRTVWLSTPRAMPSTVSPIARVGMPHAKSTTRSNSGTSTCFGVRPQRRMLSEFARISTAVPCRYRCRLPAGR